jgi:hypothetical protein
MIFPMCGSKGYIGLKSQSSKQPIDRDQQRHCDQDIDNN